MDFLYEKPKAIGPCLPVNLKIEVRGVDNPDFKFAIRQAPDCPAPFCPEALPIIKKEGCYYWIQLPESLAKYGAGVHDVKVYDGCDECDSFEIRFSHE